jgi:hypothetical protein
LKINLKTLFHGSYTRRYIKMARRRGSNNKPHLLSEGTVKKFMKLSGLETHSNGFRKDMGYENDGRERYWEQPGLSNYRSRLNEEMEGNVSQDPGKAIGPGAEDQLSEEEEMEMGGSEMMADEEAAPDEGIEAKVEEIVTAIADAIEQAVPEVTVDVEAGGDAAPPAEPEMEMDAAPVADAGPLPGEEPEAEEEGTLQETIRKAIREAFRMREEMEGNVSQDPNKAIGPGAQDQLSEEEEAEAAPPEGGAGDAPEVEAVVSAIVDAIEASTGMQVQADPAPEEAPAAEDEEAAAMDRMMEALSNRKTAKRLIENVLRRAKAQAKRNAARPQRRVRRRR